MCEGTTRVGYSVCHREQGALPQLWWVVRSRLPLSALLPGLTYSALLVCSAASVQAHIRHLDIPAQHHLPRGLSASHIRGLSLPVRYRILEQQQVPRRTVRPSGYHGSLFSVHRIALPSGFRHVAFSDRSVLHRSPDPSVEGRKGGVPSR